MTTLSSGPRVAIPQLLGTFAMLCALSTGAAAQTITEIIDATGDGGGNTLSFPYGLVVDSSGNVFVAGAGSDNGFQITPGGTITEIIDETGDYLSNVLDAPRTIAVNADGVYIPGFYSDNVFRASALPPLAVPSLGPLGFALLCGALGLTGGRRLLS